MALGWCYWNVLESMRAIFIYRRALTFSGRHFDVENWKSRTWKSLENERTEHLIVHKDSDPFPGGHNEEGTAAILGISRDH